MMTQTYFGKLSREWKITLIALIVGLFAAIEVHYFASRKELEFT